MHAPKNGFFYVINRENGQLLSAEKLGKVTWASHVDLKTGRPVEIAGARYEDGEATVWPSPFGLHSWHAMSYNPNTGLVYIPTIAMPGEWRDTSVDLKAWESNDSAERDRQFRFRVGVEFEGDTPADYGTASLVAWDPLKHTKVWEQELPPLWNPGTMTTAGNLVFQGRADGEFAAYQAQTGEKLWSTQLGLGISAPPITYSVDGKQYVSLLVGPGGAALLTGSLQAQHGWKYGVHTRRMFTFALDGTQAIPETPPLTYAEPIDVPDFEINDELVEQGATLYAESCTWCHGGGGVAGGMAPDLRESPIVLSHGAFKTVVEGGAKVKNGMPQFRHLGDREIDALTHYIRKMARNAVQKSAAVTQ